MLCLIDVAAFPMRDRGRASITLGIIVNARDQPQDRMLFAFADIIKRGGVDVTVDISVRDIGRILCPFLHL